MSNLILVSLPSTDFAAELRLLPRMFDSGLQRLHLRKPQSTASEVAQFISQLPSSCRSKIVVHQHHELANEYKLGGIHYKESTLPNGLVTFKPGLTSSASFHSLQQLGVCRGDLDYVFLSPIYDSISKDGYKSPFQDLDELSHYVCTSRYPVIALGGVSPEKFENAAEIGFSGVALLGSIWQADDPVLALERALIASENVSWALGGLSCNTG